MNYDKFDIEYNPKKIELEKRRDDLKIKKNKSVDKKSEVMYNKGIQENNENYIPIFSELLFQEPFSNQLKSSLVNLDKCILFINKKADSNNGIDISKSKSSDKKKSSIDFSMFTSPELSNISYNQKSIKDEYLKSISDIDSVCDIVKQIKKMFISDISFSFSNFINKINIGANKNIIINVLGIKPYKENINDDSLRHLYDLSNISDLEADMKLRMMSKVYSEQSSSNICNSVKLSSIKFLEYKNNKKKLKKDKNSFLKSFSYSKLDKMTDNSEKSIANNLYSMVSWFKCYSIEIDDYLNILSDKIISIKSIDELKQK